MDKSGEKNRREIQKCDKKEEAKGLRRKETGGETKCGLSEVCSKKGRHRVGNSK